MTESHTKQEPFDLDSILAELGSFGRFQKLNFILFCIPIMFNAVISLSYVFTAGVVPHRCVVPECESMNTLTWIPFAIPQKSDKTLERCKRFMPLSTSCLPESFNQSHVLECKDLVFETDEITISNEWNITCDSNKWKLTLVGTLNNIGQFFCMIFTGFVSDNFGRKTALVIGMVMGGIFGMIRSFSQNYMMFIAFEMLDALFSSGGASVAFVLGLEFVQPQHRVLGGVTFSGVYPVMAMFMAYLAYYLQNWRHLLLSLYIPMIFGFTYIWLIPESLRWLHTKSHMKDISEIVQAAAKMNNVQLEQKTLDMLTQTPVNSHENTNQTEIKSESVLSIFKHKRMFFLVANCAFCILTNTFVYFGLSLNSVTLAGSKYLNFALSSFIEIPAHVIGYVLIIKAGRRWSVSSSLMLAGVFCIGTEFLPIDATQWRFTFYLLGKLSIATSFTIIYIYATEMFPTTMRNTLFGICSMFGKLGSIIAPQMPLLASFYPPLPLFLFGGFSLVSAILSLTFPETANCKLPDTIEEVLNLGKDKNKEVESK